MVTSLYVPASTWVRNGNPPTVAVGLDADTMLRLRISFCACSAMRLSAALAATRSATTNSPPSTTSSTTSTVRPLRPRLATRSSSSELQQQQRRGVDRRRGEREGGQWSLHVPREPQRRRLAVELAAG